MERKQQATQPSFWREPLPATPDVSPVAPRLKSTRRGKPLPMATGTPLWTPEPGAGPRTLSELQALVAHYPYQDLPEPLQSDQLPSGAHLDRYDGGYEIRHTNPATKTLFAKTHQEQHMVSLSGGLGSALSAERVIQKYGRGNVLLWFADVQEENRDLYRFLHDLMKRWQGMLYWYTDGRTPPDVWKEHHWIPNSLVAPCSYELKIEPFRAFIQAMPVLPRVYIGYKPHETDRQAKTRASYAEAIPAAQVDYPLLWEPAETRDLMQVCETELGIDPPLLYKLGYDYNNCNGTCCRNGLRAWVRTLQLQPDAYAERETWEQEARNSRPSLAQRSFAKRERGGEKEHVTLAQLREEYRDPTKAAHYLKIDP